MYDYRYRFFSTRHGRDSFFSQRNVSFPTSVVFLTIHDTLLIARGQRASFFFAMVLSAVDTM